MAQDGVPRWYFPDSNFGLRIADDGTVELVALSGLVALSVTPTGAVVGALMRAEDFADPTSAQDLATKHYVDTHAGGGSITLVESTDLSLTVTGGVGPTVNLKVANSPAVDGVTVTGMVLTV